MRNRLSNQIKNLVITNIEETVIIGCLLGDATLSQSGRFHRLRVEQKLDHKEFVDWKFNLLKRLCITQPQLNPGNASYRFGTVGHPELTKLKSMFFRDDNSINPEVLGKIDNLSIAIWFMDDGYKIHGTIGISTNNFSQLALDQLISLLKKFGISAGLQKDKQGKRIYIKTSSYKSFYKLVKPYIDQVQCMAYKLP